MKPLAGEVGDQRLRSGVGEHAFDLMIEDDRIAKLVFLGNLEQFVIGDTTPEKERETRGELEVADAIRRIWSKCLRLILEAEQKIRAHQDAPKRQFHARFETVLLRGLLI